MNSYIRPFAIVTGASTGIGYELAKRCAENGFDLLVAADEPAINQAAQDFRALGVNVEAVEADLATAQGGRETVCRGQGETVKATRRWPGRKRPATTTDVQPIYRRLYLGIVCHSHNPPQFLPQIVDDPRHDFPAGSDMRTSHPRPDH
jgi:NAD(P)-dependent dehydrogenase (short-subunit alcohol dehydrogenase family)